MWIDMTKARWAAPSAGQTLQDRRHRVDYSVLLMEYTSRCFCCRIDMTECAIAQATGVGIVLVARYVRASLVQVLQRLMDAPVSSLSIYWRMVVQILAVIDCGFFNFTN